MILVCYVTLYYASQHEMSQFRHESCYIHLKLYAFIETRKSFRCCRLWLRVV